MAVALFNRGATEATVAARWSDLGLTGTRYVRDLWRQKPLGRHRDRFSASVKPHGVALLKVSKTHPIL